MMRQLFYISVLWLSFSTVGLTQPSPKERALKTTTSDAPIYQAASSKGVQWGQRVYYYNCHREGGDYAWFKDNLSAAGANLQPGDINASWAMDGRWDPLKNSSGNLISAYDFIEI